MFPFIFESKYGMFIIFLGVMLLNGILMRQRVQPFINENPSLESGYNMLIAGMIGGNMLPFLMFLWAVTVGKYDTIFDVIIAIYNPVMDPFVIFVFVVGIAETLTYFIWVCFLGGAEYIAEYPGLWGNTKKYSPMEIKFQAIALLVASVAGLVFISYYQNRFIEIMK